MEQLEQKPNKLALTLFSILYGGLLLVAILWIYWKNFQLTF